MLRKIASWILLVLAVLGLLICLGGIFGVWYARSAVDVLVDDLLAKADGYLQRADDVLTEADNRLAAAGSKVGEVKTATQEMVASGQNPVVEVLQSVLGDDALTRVEAVGPLVEGALSAASGVNDTLIAVNRLPSVDVPVFTEELANITQRLTEMQSQIASLRTTVEQADGARIVAAVDDLTLWLEETRATLGESATRVQTTQGELVTLRGNFPGYTSLASISLTLFLALMAAGQLSLIADCWRWARS